MRKLIVNTDFQRKCRVCSKIKELNNSNFHNEKSRPLGYSYVCKPCEKIRSKEKYIKNPRLDRYKLMTKEQKNNKLKGAVIYSKTDKGRAIRMLASYITFDKQKNRVFNLSQDFLINKIFNSKCFYCGYTNDLGCDRIDNKIGHITTNVIPCCKECNIARMDNFTVDEMKIIGIAIKKVKDNRIK